MCHSPAGPSRHTAPTRTTARTPARTLTPGATPTDPPQGVPGWAFRAQVLHVAEATGLPWRVVTQQAGLDAAAAARLLRCRPRRGRVPLAEATAVFGLDAARLRHRAELSVDAHHTRVMVQALRQAGFPLGDVAGFLRLSRPQTRALFDARTRRCSQRTEWLAQAALQALGVPCPLSQPTWDQPRLTAARPRVA
ncbi:hypothetical protein ACPCG0_11095 [Propionibacteriaceae bacterium Y1923]|uniref:hypothetical protein n=1 Tax=Aestuariimicrobium sp. Y1814 TaxID=3418742 RepID=UPI003C26CEAA